MQKLLTAALLLAGCALHPASAQEAPSPLNKAGATSSAAQVPDWVAAEFGEAYGRYFPDLSDFYKYSVGQALCNTPLVASDANLTSLLAQSAALREAVYQTIYQYCHARKYGLGSDKEVDALVYHLLYHDLHLSDLAASRLAPYIVRRYKQPVPPPQYSAAPAGPALAEGQTAGPTARLLTGVTPPNSLGSGLEAAGWRFDTVPVVEAVDDGPGVVRFKLKINKDGEVESVMKVSGNVSPAQERLCRDKLQNASFSKINAGAGAVTGYYTFHFSVR